MRHSVPTVLTAAPLAVLISLVLLRMVRVSAGLVAVAFSAALMRRACASNAMLTIPTKEAAPQSGATPVAQHSKPLNHKSTSTHRNAPLARQCFTNSHAVMLLNQKMVPRHHNSSSACLRTGFFIDAIHVTENNRSLPRMPAFGASRTLKRIKHPSKPHKWLTAAVCSRIKSERVNTIAPSVRSAKLERRVQSDVQQ